MCLGFVAGISLLVLLQIIIDKEGGSTTDLNLAPAVLLFLCTPFVGAVAFVVQYFKLMWRGQTKKEVHAIEKDNAEVKTVNCREGCSNLFSFCFKTKDAESELVKQFDISSPDPLEYETNPNYQKQ